MNALDQMWGRLDELTDELIRDGDGSEESTRAAARGVAWCLSRFYGDNERVVRQMEMRRRAQRERRGATKA
jgi:hypothetical protein